MPLHAIQFPLIDPVLIDIGPFELRWYALAYVAGLLLGWWYCLRLAGKSVHYAGVEVPVTRHALDDFLVWVTLGVVLGGRLGFVLFYNPGYYLANPMQIPMLWQGGMSFHGGLAGVILATLLFARQRNIPPLVLGDLLAAAAPIGLFFGRIANFINAELYGRTTNLPWGVYFPHAGPDPRHPSQLYEAVLEGALLFVILRMLIGYGALTRPGFITGAFLIGYGLGRSFAELFREPDPQIGFLFGGLTMGMLLSFPMIVIGAWLVARALKQPALGAAEAERPGT
ncbi:MAG: prolipoprotein diacylglyceryl transferase [Pseudomonadota bacterium]